MVRAFRAICVMAAACAAACAEPRSVPVIGPDGSRMLHVSCGGDEARCFELAGRACPMGDDMQSTAGGNFLVRCRAPGNVAMLSQDGVLAPSPYVIVPAMNTQALAPNPYRGGPPPGPTSVPPGSTATFPPLVPPTQRGTGQDVGY